MALDGAIDAHFAARRRWARSDLLWTAAGIAILTAAPFFVYPVFLIKLLCMALFACAFNLMIGGGPRTWPPLRRNRHSPPGHLFRDDYLGAGASDLFSRAAPAFHP